MIFVIIVIIIFMKIDQQSGDQTYKQSLLQESRRHCKGNPSFSAKMISAQLLFHSEKSPGSFF